MKTKKFFIVGIFFSLFHLISCADDEIINASALSNAKDSASSNDGILSGDSLVIKFKMQSNPELILTDRIICKNSVFVLDLSQDEASELMIPNDMYQKYVKHVEYLNKESK